MYLLMYFLKKILLRKQVNVNRNLSLILVPFPTEMFLL